MNFKRVERHLLIILNILLTLIACFYIFSGGLKIINPNQIISTIRLLFNQVFGYTLSLKIALILVIVLISWEILLGFLFLVKIKVLKVIKVFFITNLFFTCISHYLYYLEELKSCGCLGYLSSKFQTYHFIILYIFNIILIIAVFFLPRRYNDNSSGHVSL